MRFNFKWLASNVFCVCLLFCSQVVSAQLRPVKESALPDKFSYQAFELRDRYERTLRVYATPMPEDDRALVLVLLGSGCGSVFTKMERGIGVDWYGIIHDLAGPQVQLVMVEKHGVALFDRRQKSGTDECSSAFLSQDWTRWPDSLSDVIDGVLRARSVVPRRIAVIGHSEGGALAPKVALQNKHVTHVVALAGVPSPQLLDAVDFAADGRGQWELPKLTSNQRLVKLLRDYKVSAADPKSSKMSFGHTHRYWAEKNGAFSYDAYANLKLKTLLVVGTADVKSSHRSVDAFAVELIVRGADLSYVRIENGDHGLSTPSRPDGMLTIVESSTKWILDQEFDKRELVWPLSK